MASERDPTTWRNPEVSSASGGHAAPEVRTAPVLEEPATRAEDVVSPPVRPAASARRRRVVTRRRRREVRRVDTVSVLRLSVCFYGVFLVAWLLLWAVIYWMLSAAGVFDALHKVATAGFPEVSPYANLSLLGMEKWALVAGVVLAVLGSLLNGFLAFVYNIAADMVGGVGLTFLERDSDG